MARHIEAWLNGVSLRDAVPMAWIKDAVEEAAAPTVTAASTPGWDGQRPIYLTREYFRVTLTVILREVRDVAARAMAVEALNGWCGQGGLLQLNYRPDRRLRVTRTRVPALGSARNYTTELALELTAYEVPFWEDWVPTAAERAADEDPELTFSIGGTVQTPLDIILTPAEALSGAVEVTCGACAITLTGLTVAAGAPIAFRHTGQDWLTITAGGVSLLERRTGASADDLLLTPGANRITWDCAAACSARLEARGRYE